MVPLPDLTIWDVKVLLNYWSLACTDWCGSQFWHNDLHCTFLTWLYWDNFFYNLNFQWEKCCESLKKAFHSPQSGEQPPKDIQNDITYISSNINENNFCNSYSSVVVPSSSINVMPLQIATNDKYQDSKSLFGGAQGYNGKFFISIFFVDQLVELFFDIWEIYS